MGFKCFNNGLLEKVTKIALPLYCVMFVIHSYDSPQVMYGAIQRLDEKFEQLQAKVTNIHLIQLSPEVVPLQKVIPTMAIAP